MATCACKPPASLIRYDTTRMIALAGGWWWGQMLIGVVVLRCCCWLLSAVNDLLPTVCSIVVLDDTDLRLQIQIFLRMFGFTQVKRGPPLCFRRPCKLTNRK
ncbi:unnamed protein product [Laminaria digitata]